ncbi:MAG: hypothetical protein F6J97_25965 [Leptolyngbya sp. SIO4C1]|nr:hypothetical protein [Leptolyngbya sp. SIO4C1]
MALFIRPDEAQAIQEDEVQLLSAGAQLMHQLSALIQRTQLARPPLSADTLQIQMGRRLIYGQLPNGQFRNELDSLKLKVILGVIQKAVAPGAAPYQDSLPALEIREGDTLLFRQEMDGTATVNQLQPQSSQSDIVLSRSGESQAPERTRQLEETVRQFLQVAKT